MKPLTLKPSTQLTGKVARLTKELDLTPYAGCWVAIVRGGVTGVGATERAARLASKYQRPKEEPEVVFVPEAQMDDGGWKTR
jgi:hypothetical protein